MGTTREASKVTTVFETVSVCGARVPVPLVAKAPEAPPTAQSVVLNWPVILRVSSLCHAPASSMLPPVQLRKGGRQIEKTHNTEGLGAENISMFFSNSIANRKGFLPRPALFRAWVQGGSVQAGAWQEDTVREVYGSMSGRNSWIYVEGKGALATTGSTDYFLAQISPGGDGVFSGFDFRLSRSIPTGPITAPPHVWQPVILYLGEKA